MALLVCLFLAALATAAPRGMMPADTIRIREIDEIRISPDGGTVVFTLGVKDLQKNRTDGRLMRVPAAGGAMTAFDKAPEGASAVRWSPDGKRLAFIAQKAVWVLDAASGPATRVCAYDKGNAFLSKAGSPLAWSPDGKRLAFAGTLEPAPPPQDPLIISRLQFKGRTAMSDNRRSHIYVVDAAGGAVPAAITEGRYDEHSIDWGSAGIAFLSNREPDPDANLNYDIFLADPQTRAVRRLTRTPGVEMEPRISPDGKLIACTATKRPVTTIDSVAEDAHVWIVPVSGGPGREVNAALDRRSGAPEWMPDSKTLVYTASDRGKTILVRQGAAAVRLVDRDAQVAGISVAANTGTIVYGLSDPGRPKEIYRHGAGAITSVNGGFRWPLVKPETLRFRSFDGLEVEGWLYPALAPSGKTPMLLSIHGGPHGMYGYAFSPAFQAYAARGYATLAINPRGSSGYGQKFSDGCVGNWGGGDYRDLMAGLDYVLKTHPEIDGARLGVIGSSYGGFMTNWVVTQTQRFKAAVAGASLSNLVSFYATSLYQDLVHAEFGGFPWDGNNFAELWKWSPLAHVRNVTTPVMFVHGEADNDVHITQAEEMYVALRRRGIEAAMARYPREGHGFREPKHLVDALTRELEWMDRHLR